MLFFAQHGYRVIAHDRRGHGLSQDSSRNDMNTYADDLAALINHLDLTNAVLVGHSTGGARSLAILVGTETKRAEKVVLIAAVPPILLKSDVNPEGIPIDVFDGLRSGLAQDPSQFYKGLRDDVLRRKSCRCQGLAGHTRPVLVVEHARQFEEHL